jgi:UDP-galactopyranose mutase
VRDLICLSHLRWNFVFQRPQHLLGRAAGERRVFFVEEPFATDGEPFLEQRTSPEGVRVCVPHLPDPNLASPATLEVLARLLHALVEEHEIVRPVVWHYSPMWEPVFRGVDASAVVYDCMDELSAFRFAPPELLERERSLLRRADLVFTGGRSLWEAKRDQHPSVHCFPSSVDVEHWRQAREGLPEPVDMADIPHPRLGYAGVIDERLDLDLIREAAARRPDWHWVLVGPVAKIDPASVPRSPNVHLLGGKEYTELPAYMAHWDVALMPFALNESTRFISPTKTPEYLAAGLPVVSTPVRDVVRTYGEPGLVEIAAAPDSWIAACERALEDRDPGRRTRADALLDTMSWDTTWSEMDRLIRTAQRGRDSVSEPSTAASTL